MSKFCCCKIGGKGAGWCVFAAGNVDPTLALCLCSLPFLRLAATPSANEDEEAETLQGKPHILGKGCVTPFILGCITLQLHHFSIVVGRIDIKRSSFAVGREAGTVPHSLQSSFVGRLHYDVQKKRMGCGVYGDLVYRSKQGL